MRALRSAGVIPQWVRHFNLALIDEVWDLAETLFEGGGALALPGWRRTLLMKTPLLHQGFHYGLEALKQPGREVASSSHSSMSEAQWLAGRLGSQDPIRTHQTAEDVDALLAEGANASAESLMQVARDRGLYLSPPEAAGFIDAVVADERARVRLDESGYREFQQALRQRAPPKPAAPPLALGATVGSAELPGPLGPMLAAVRDPAVLSEGSVADDDSDPDDGPASAAAPSAPAAACAKGKRKCPTCSHEFYLRGISEHLKVCGLPTKRERNALKAKAKRAEAAAAKKARMDADEEGAADALQALSGHHT